MTPSQENQDGVPEGLITAVVELVGTGPVALGAYTLAEIAAVDGVIDFIEREPGAGAGRRSCALARRPQPDHH